MWTWSIVEDHDSLESKNDNWLEWKGEGKIHNNLDKIMNNNLSDDTSLRGERSKTQWHVKIMIASNRPPTNIGAGHEWIVPTSVGHF